MKRAVVLGTGNTDKLKELQNLLRGSGIKVHAVGEFGKPPKVVENGNTFEKNAIKKARAYAKMSDLVTLADDSGLCVRVLNRRPGVFSARFAGPGCTYDDNNRKLLRLLAKKKGKDRAAKFHSVIAVFVGRKKLGIFEGICPGRIAEKKYGKNGFGYDPVFVPTGSKKTYAQMTHSQKNRVSHRSRALQKAKRFLIGYFRLAIPLF